MPNECWRKIQQREIVITNKDDIMTCVQENNLFKKIWEILQMFYAFKPERLCLLTNSGKQLSRLGFWMCRRVTSLPLFSEYLLSQLSVLKVSLLNKLQHFYFKHSALWMDPIRMFGKCSYFSGIGTACRIIKRIFRIILCILIPE